MSPIISRKASRSLLLSRGKKEIEFCKPPDMTHTRKNAVATTFPLEPTSSQKRTGPSSLLHSHLPLWLRSSFFFFLNSCTDMLPLTAVNKKHVNNQTGWKEGGPQSPGLYVSVINATIRCESNGTALFPQEERRGKKKENPHAKKTKHKHCFRAESIQISLIF